MRTVCRLLVYVLLPVAAAAQPRAFAVWERPAAGLMIGPSTNAADGSGDRSAEVDFVFDTPVVFLPQTAILGTGVVVKRPGIVTVEGKDAISVRSYVYLALSYDHRVIDGADAARFLGAVKSRLEAAAFEGQLGV